MAVGYDNDGYVVGDPKDQNYNTKGWTSERPQLSDEEIRKEKRRILKNVIVISFSFMLLFTAFQSMANLQSSINKVSGLGIWSLSAIYLSLVFSCAFLPSYVINKLTVKWAMVVSMLCYSTYIAAQFYPEFYTLIPGALILGMGAAPMWSAKCTYLSQVGNKYAELSGVAVEPVIVRFFGIFFLFFQFSSVWGNLIASQVLARPPTEISKDALSLCGVNYCPSAPEPTLSANASTDLSEAVEAIEDNFSTSKSKLYTLAGIYLFCSIVSGLVVSVLVDPLSRYGEHERHDDKEKLTGVELLVATFLHLSKPYQILIIPLTFWSGVEQGFFGADFTAGFVSCAYGVQNVGYVLMCYGVTDAICSFSFGFIIKKVGRVPIFLMGAVINVVVVAVLFSWSPNPEEAYLFYVMAAFWGAADAVWQTQINALYGVLFESDEEAAFSNYRLWESLGFIFAYVLQNTVCVYTKLWVVIGVLACGMAGYLIIEVIECKKRPSN